MKNLKVSDETKNLVSVVCVSLIPALLSFLIFLLFGEKINDSNDFAKISSIVSAVVTIIAFYLFYRIIPRIPYFRPYRKYEGRWLQIIPNSDRPISIINFRFLKDTMRYELNGFNFNLNCETGVEFVAHKFVQRDYYEGFYYITEHTWEQKNGLGKVGFISNNIDNLTRAEGYFFDVSNEECSKKYDTVMIKCDDKFFSYINPMLCDTKYNKLPEKMVAKMSVDFVKGEIKNYKELHSSESQQSHRRNKKIPKKVCKTKVCRIITDIYKNK